MEQPTRRNALRRGLVALGGLAGVGVAGRAAAGAVVRTTGTGTTMSFTAPHLPGSTGGAWSRRAGGETSAARADLFARGRRIGEVHVATVPVLGPGLSAPDTGSMEWHTFHLEGGTIIGSGTAGTERGSFAILGGTGRFANARGTYELSRAAGGPGAEFFLRLQP
jgi:hypothetical protein